MDKFTHNLRKLIEIQGLSAAMGSISAAVITLVRVNRRIAMEEVRCKYCRKKLGEIEGKAEIVCPRCKVKNRYDTNKSIRKKSV